MRKAASPAATEAAGVHRKVGVLGLLEEPCEAGRIAWGRREDKELIYWHAILLSPKHPL